MTADVLNPNPRLAGYDYSPSFELLFAYLENIMLGVGDTARVLMTLSDAGLVKPVFETGTNKIKFESPEVVEEFGAVAAELDAINAGLRDEATARTDADAGLQTALDAEAARATAAETAHASRSDNPHEVTLQQAATQQATAPVVLPATQSVFEGSISDGNKYLTRLEVQAETTFAMHYKGQLKYGALTLADMDAIAGMTAGDACGVQESQLTYQWDGAAWQEQPPGEDFSGDVWDIALWYGVWNGVAYAGDVSASIKCKDGATHQWDLLVHVDVIHPGTITDTEIGTRELLDNPANPSLVSTAAKTLGAWLQGFRDNHKWLFAEKLGKSEVEAGYTPEGTLDINGVTGYTEMNDGEEISLYSHYLKIRVMNGNDFVIWFGGVIFLNDATPFTATSFFQWLAAQNFTTEARAFPINGRYTTNGSSSLDAGAVWINAAATQISLTTIASSGTATQNITLSDKTVTVDDFVQPAPFNIASHRHSFAIEDMSGGFSGVPAPNVVQMKAPDAAQVEE